MLKITTEEVPLRLVLSGSLAGPWVDTLRQSWLDAAGCCTPREVTIDLSDVTYVDVAGREALAAMHAEGAKLIATGGGALLIRDITGTIEPRARRRGLSGAFLWLVAALMPLALTACSNVRAGASDDPAATGGRPAVAVSVAPVVTGNLTEAIEVVGALAPKFATDIKSEVSGTVAEVYVTEWVPVRTGTRLARLQTAEAEAIVEAARAVAAQARVAETRARREDERALQLRQYGLITPQAADDARSALEAAEATTAAADAQGRAAEARLAKLFITAPMDGVIALRGVNAGDRVENMGSAGPMFRIVDNRLLELTVSVPSVSLGALRTGQILEFGVDALPGRTFAGRVAFINPVVDDANRSVKVVADVPNGDLALKGGLFARGRIVVSTQANVLQVPRAALTNWDVGKATADVFVVRDGKAEKRAVRTGQMPGSMVEITAGLAVGERVVTRGAFALKPGDRVTVDGEGV